jgi:hypothetical protein
MTAGIKANADGSAAIQVGGSDAITITSGLDTTFAGTVTSTGVITSPTGVIYPLVRGTAVTASGTSVDFTGIPSTVRRITVMFNGISTNGTSNLLIQLGGSAGPIITGYTGASSYVGPSSVSTIVLNTGFVFSNWGAAANVGYGSIAFTNITANQWIASGTVGNTNSASNFVISGSISLGILLDRVRITTINGTDTFDAGTINIMWE